MYRLVAVPDRGFAKSDDRSGWNAGFIDAPPPQLAPVDLARVQIDGRGVDAVGLFSTEHTEGELAGAANRLRLAVKIATHDAVTHCRVDPAIGRGVGRGRDSVDVFQRVVLVPRAVLGDEQVVDNGVFRQPRQPPLELGGRKARQVVDGQSRFERTAVCVRIASSNDLSAGAAPATTKTFLTSGCSFSIRASVAVKFRSWMSPVEFGPTRSSSDCSPGTRRAYRETGRPDSG